jgi:hypothetical protein
VLPAEVWYGWPTSTTSTSTLNAGTISSSAYGVVYFPVPSGTMPTGSGIGDPRDGGERSHEGLDIFGPAGSSIVAAVSGTVVKTSTNSTLGGVTVTIKDSLGNLHYYAHMDPKSAGLLTVGQKVNAGQLIGYVGTTGNAAGTSPHLHYSINEGQSSLIDPFTLLSSGDIRWAEPMSTSNGSTTTEALNIPTDGKWYKSGSEYIIAFEFWGTPDKTGPSQVVFYSGTPPPGTHINADNAILQEKISTVWLDGGTVDSFRGAQSGKSYQDLVNNVLFQLGLAGTDALNDPGVIAIIGLAMTRELSPEELSNRLRQTQWYQSRTDTQREWDDLADAEKEARIVDEAMKLNGLWFTYVGEDLNVGGLDLDGDGLVSAAELKKGNADLFAWAERVASGQATQSQAVNSWMKTVAAENPNSPWSRTIREEEQAQGQFGADVANMAGQLRDLHWEWGIPLTDAKLNRLAEDIVMNRAAYEDVEQSLRDQAMGLYPHKPPSLSTRQWAEPYMQTYMGTLEVPEVDLTDSLLQRGLADGMTLADFQKMLRHDDRWLQTSGARSEVNDKISALGRVMGF